MAEKSGDSAILNLGEIGEEGLNFTSGAPGTSTTTHTFESQAPDSALDIDDQDLAGSDDKTGLLDGEKKPTTYNFWSMSFYSQFFDVDTSDVQQRLLWSILPRPSATSEFVRTKIRPNPDLYGPFWVCVTLIFSVAISGNVASYLQAALVQDEAVRGFKWHYDFHKVTLAASAVFAYAWLVPAGLYATMWAQGGQTASIMELLCVYGYSLSIFIPVSVLWTIQSAVLQWTLVVVATVVSGAVLVLALWNNMIKDNVRKNVAFIMIAVVIGLHLLLAMGFMLYFFHVPNATAVTAGPAAPDGAVSPEVNPVKLEDSGEEAKLPEAPPKVDPKEDTAKEVTKRAIDPDPGQKVAPKAVTPTEEKQIGPAKEQS